MLLDPETGHGLLFIEGFDPTAGKNRVQLDLHARTGTRDEEVIRLAGIGATVVADRRDVLRAVLARLGCWACGCFDMGDRDGQGPGQPMGQIEPQPA